MLLSNDFVVAADLDKVWAHLLDMENVAACVPGAKVEEVVPPGTYKGTIRLKIGPMTVTYRGQATLVGTDEARHEATIELKAREARGQGSAVATVRNRLEPSAQGTRVIAETDLQITGPQAQFGKGVLEDVGGRILEEFSARLERQINGEHRAGDVAAGGPAAEGDAAAPPSPPASAASDPEDDALDLNKILSASITARAGMLAPLAAAVVALVAILLVWRRSRH